MEESANKLNFKPSNPDLDSRLAYPRPRPRPRLAYTRPRPRPRLKTYKTNTGSP